MNVTNFKLGMPFTDSEFVKHCLLGMFEDMCSETSASRSETVRARRVQELGKMV
jgi:hypothetical protein